jgi:hypothetical protein
MKDNQEQGPTPRKYIINATIDFSHVLLTDIELCPTILNIGTETVSPART